MTTEDYVSFEIAKLLKEKGFNESCDRTYVGNNPQKLSRSQGFNNSYYKEFYKDISICSAPTLSLAMKWLREVHNVFINISFRFSYNADNDINFSYYVKKYGSNCGYGDGEFTSYEEACGAAIKYCLENLI